MEANGSRPWKIGVGLHTSESIEVDRSRVSRNSLHKRCTDGLNHSQPFVVRSSGRYSAWVAKRRPTRTYHVYIIELSRECVEEPCALAPVYVGQTAHTPEHRFTQHKAGGRLAARMPHRFGIRLRYDLMKAIGPFSTRTEAEVAEKAVATALENRGHRVFWS
jgi:hypothetical protein